MKGDEEMSETPETQSDSAASAKGADPPRSEAGGRILFLLASGLLLATLVSCACNPVR